MTREGIIPRKRRRFFEPFLQHNDPQVRALAEEMLEEDLAIRSLIRVETDLYESRAETLEQEEMELDDGSWLRETPF